VRENHRIRLWIAGGIVFRAHVDRNLLDGGTSAKDGLQPFHQQDEGTDMRVILAHFPD